MSERQGCGKQILIASVLLPLTLFWLWLFLSSAGELIVALSRGTPFNLSSESETEAFKKEGHSYASLCDKISKKNSNADIKTNPEKCLDWKVLWGIRKQVQDQPQTNSNLSLPAFDSKDLDTIPRRLQRLRNYQQELILTKDSIIREMRNASDSGTFSPQLLRAAMDARAPSPIEFLKNQAARYGISISPEVIKYFNDRSDANNSPQQHLLSTLSANKQT